MTHHNESITPRRGRMVAYSEVVFCRQFSAAFQNQAAVWITSSGINQSPVPKSEGPRAPGNFAELEGSAEWIDDAAARLGVDSADYITLSYGRLFDQWREQHHSDAKDLTFTAVGSSA